MKRSWLVCLVVAGLSACGGFENVRNPSGFILPANIRKVAVTPFINKTQYFGMEDRLRLKVEQEFIRDGRLTPVSQESESDGVLYGEIVNYIRQVVTYDGNNQPLEYRLWVIVNLRFQDTKADQTLWDEPRVEQSFRYFVETQAGGMTEEEARERMWDLFSRDIVKRTMEGFGSVTGASEKKVPEGTLPPPDAKTLPPATPRVPPPPPY